MNISNSECSSGCESGWTMYFDQNSNYAGRYNPGFGWPVDEDYPKGSAYANKDTEGEDLSMVSDASSGPPIFIEYSESADGRQKKNKQKKKTKDQPNLHLDDTASSPVFHFSQDHVGSFNNHTAKEYVPYFSQGSSVANFEGESTRKKHLNFLKSSKKGKSASGKSEGLMGRKKHQEMNVEVKGKRQ
ncbi:uncharacterized protein LOC111367398 isoform X3 [Olea europaea var. sylvestris]|uniref:uncharacterized protein LOC111367398 isoform X3 n=1 Tax=Olea europaea var. sylvestris TaxID=158386 RepID=UPI000C1CEF05|nr:uncharacterized protein LOC111367398 isoform X3 [Olea europaea var. sylvestris]